MIGDIYIQTTEETRMIDTKKEQERDELHRAIFSIDAVFSGAVDGWEVKD